MTPIDLTTNTPGKPVNLGFSPANTNEAFAIMPLTCGNQVGTDVVTRVASGSPLSG